MTKQDIKKLLRIEYPVLYGELENEKKKNQKIFDLPERGFLIVLAWKFLICALNLNFLGR